MLCNVCTHGLENARQRSELGSAEKHIADSLGSQLSQYDFAPRHSSPTFWYLHKHHCDESSFTRSVQDECVMCSDFPFYDTEQSNKVKEYGFFTVFWISYEKDTSCMTVDSGHGSKTISLVKNSTGSPKTCSTVSKWMGTCLEHHSLCRKRPEDENYIPTRLLRINRSPSPYVTLSYRWGDKPPDKTVRLLKSTYTQPKKPNAIDTLPKTLRDAMYIAGRFGDTTEDWRKEASTMRDVYQNALFCISALGADDDEGGCLFPRNPSFERVMATRTVYFGKNQVFWECTEMHACETRPKGIGQIRAIHDPRLIAVSTAVSSTRDPLAHTLAEWSIGISLYSHTKLTVPSDKLVAISGLAKGVKKGLELLRPGGNRYLAATCYRAPSWSWASLDGPLIVPDTLAEGVVELSSLVFADVNLLGADDTGEVVNGRLILNGPACLIEAHVLADHQYIVDAFREFSDRDSVRLIKDDEVWQQPTVIFDTLDDTYNKFTCIWTVAQPAVLGGWQVSGLALRYVEHSAFMRIGVVSCYHINHTELTEFVETFSQREVRII
ncbi:HET-domain-containing protein [Daldinia sp. FL1419]|nr:HET-domain-containing protein [Daldinia sp. FL1419]